MGQRLALIIGNSTYQDGSLSRLLTPDADVGALGEILLDPEMGAFDDVNVLINMSSHIIRRAIATFFTKKSREDLLLLYFSGHGVLDDQGHLFLAVRDTDSKLLRGTAISANYITEEMNNSRSQRQLLILDCCHSGAFARGAKGQPGASVGTAAAFEGTGYGRVVLTASDATQYAWEGEQVIGDAENSLFTHYVLQGIRDGTADLNGDGQITIDELFDYVYEEVIRQTTKQTPGKWSYKERGEIIVSIAPGVVPEEKVDVSIPAFEEDIDEKLELLFNEGLNAYWLEEWDKAVHCFKTVVEARPDFPDAANKLELSQRKQQVRTLYERALEFERAEDWPNAVAAMKEVIALEPDYKDVSTRLEHAQIKHRLMNLYAEARQLSQAGKWQAVVNIFIQIATLQPDYPDPEGLYSTAQANLADVERLTNLERMYNLALKEMDAGHWLQAERLLIEVQVLDPSFRSAGRLLERVRVETSALKKEGQTQTLIPESDSTDGISSKGHPETDRQAQRSSPQEWFKKYWLLIAGMAVVIAAVIGFIIWRGSEGSGVTSTTAPAVVVAEITSTPTNTSAPSTPTNTNTPTTNPSPTSTNTPTTNPTSTNTNIPTVNPTPTTVAPSTTALPHSIIDGFRVPMVLVPEGEFQMGNANGEDDEKPVHKVYLDRYYIDQTEVTNAMYAAFLNDQGNQEQGGVFWLNATGENALVMENGARWVPVSGFDDHPVVEVSWYGAHAYCVWRGARLPTEAEWEKSARGAEGSLYPWGEEFNGLKANFCDTNCTQDWANHAYNDNYARTAPVGSFLDGASPYGILDMAGNAWEWVEDWYSSDYYSQSPGRNPLGPEAGAYRILRGGSWSDSDFDLSAANRNGWGLPEFSSNNVGFRCARSP